MTCLRRLTARDWLCCYKALYAADGVSFDQFKRHMRYLAMLHGGGIPSPCIRGCVFCTDALEELSSSNSSAMSEGEGDPSRRVDLRRLVARVQQTCVRGTGGGQGPRSCLRVHATGVRRIFGAAVTDEERLFVLLMLSTRLRRGGLCCLRLFDADRRALGATGGACYRASRMPVSLPTTEKNDKCRVVRVPNICRVYSCGGFRTQGHGASTPRSCSPVASRRASTYLCATGGVYSTACSSGSG